ncbi:carbohydrate esterase family 5 protein [Collybiopsis luxurians FD-317 M1]|uniref:Cutinase n=1 Tax=Collybiopsis luxurians FD-317 M1 TaxID=944289 RepID=A0A0D0BCC9_9AGAR|nr:carbohydrate esterase family 5 protein [Collybiopsis luxurians FD-317 M1]
MISIKASFVAFALSLSAFAAPAFDTRQACADVIVVYARGTTEPAPIGTTVGPALQASLLAVLGGKSLSFQGVDYPADIPGFLEGGSPEGSTNMANMLTSAASSCPDAALVTSGYSQGGQLVHNSANLLSSSVRARINAAVIFGDPDDGEPVTGISASNTDVICHIGDDICAHGDLVLPPHLDYEMDTPGAAAFIAARV